MKDKLIQLDRLLALLTVKGDDVFLMADARHILKEIYDDVERGNEANG